MNRSAYQEQKKKSCQTEKRNLSSKKRCWQKEGSKKWERESGKWRPHRDNLKRPWFWWGAGGGGGREKKETLPLCGKGLGGENRLPGRQEGSPLFLLRKKTRPDKKISRKKGKCGTQGEKG